MSYMSWIMLLYYVKFSFIIIRTYESDLWINSTRIVLRTAESSMINVRCQKIALETAKVNTETSLPRLLPISMINLTIFTSENINKSYDGRQLLSRWWTLRENLGIFSVLGVWEVIECVRPLISLYPSARIEKRLSSTHLYIPISLIRTDHSLTNSPIHSSTHPLTDYPTHFYIPINWITSDWPLTQSLGTLSRSRRDELRLDSALLTSDPLPRLSRPVLVFPFRQLIQCNDAFVPNAHLLLSVYCTVLYCTILYYTVLYCTIL